MSSLQQLSPNIFGHSLISKNVCPHSPPNILTYLILKGVDLEAKSTIMKASTSHIIMKII